MAAPMKRNRSELQLRYRGRFIKHSQLRQLQGLTHADPYVKKAKQEHECRLRGLRDSIALDHGYTNTSTSTSSDVQSHTATVNIPTVKIPIQGRRIVDINLLAQQLKSCFNKKGGQLCETPLHLGDIVGESLYGLGSYLKIKCQTCNHINNIKTSSVNKDKAFHTNIAATAGEYKYICKTHKLKYV